MKAWKCARVWTCMKLCPEVTWGSDSVTDKQAKTVKPCRTLVQDWIVISQRADETAAVPAGTDPDRAPACCHILRLHICHYQIFSLQIFPSLKFWIPCFSYATFGCNYRSLVAGDWRGAHVFSWGLAATVMLSFWQDGMRACGLNDVSFISINTLNLKFTVKSGLIVALSKTDRNTLFHFHIFQLQWYSIWILNNKMFLFSKSLVR